VCPYGCDLHAWVQVLGVLSLHSKLLLCHMQLCAGSEQKYCADASALAAAAAATTAAVTHPDGQHAPAPYWLAQPASTKHMHEQLCGTLYSHSYLDICLVLNLPCTG
jgi:hypothetical protein